MVQASVTPTSSRLLTVSFSLPIGHLPPSPSPLLSDITCYFSGRVCFPSLSTSSGTSPSPALRSARHPLLPSISACLSRRLFLLIIPSPSPSSVTPEFIPLHQFAPTVNCVENNSACRVSVLGGTSDRSDVMAMAVGVETCAAGLHAQPAPTEYRKQKAA